MNDLRKILIVPFFGDLPPWMDKFEAPQGYTLLLDMDLKRFKERVKSKLDIEYPGLPGTGKVWDYRPALGLLYEEEIKTYDYWGHCDLDVVWGDMKAFLPDSTLNELDVYSSHHEYVCGCFSLYRNSQEVNEFFKTISGWQKQMIYPEPNGWVEDKYSRALEVSGLAYEYTFHQGNPWTSTPILKKEGIKLFQDINLYKGEHGHSMGFGGSFDVPVWKEIMFFHFRHSKKWPL